MIKPQVLVCQHGARRRYTVPRIFEQAGMLAALYTDSSSQSTIGKLASWGRYFAYGKPESLINRKVIGIPAQKVFSSDVVLLDELIRKIKGEVLTGVQLYKRRHDVLSARMKKWGLADATAVYSMFHENLEFIRWAKENDLKIIVDVFVNPMVQRVVSEELTNLPFHARIGYKSGRTVNGGTIMERNV